MTRTNKNVAAVTIPSDVNFVVIANAIFGGESTVRAAREAAEASILSASVTSLTMVRDALKGFPAVTEAMWKETYQPGLSAALKAKYTNPDSAKSVLTRWKRAILAITAGHTVHQGETLHAYLTRLYPPVDGGKGGKDKGGKDKGDTRAPQQPIAAGDTVEDDFEYACLLVADEDEKRAKLVAMVFDNAQGLEAFDAFAAAWLASRVAAKRKGFSRNR